MRSNYRPKRSTQRWLAGAPKALLACYDSGPNRGADRYTALYGAPLWEPSMGTMLPARFMSSNPSHPCGIGLFGEHSAYDRGALGKKVRFEDLPEPVRRCIERDCAED